ncbi:MAG: protein TolR [Desulfovibrio sp.]|jgi:biopolymer transport protein TolR|nr:protein TolR [Desulfovibrio sp.]
MGASTGNQNKFVSEINVTPFVDVMLVLLIIFMVATPMMSQGLDVDLPQTQQVAALPSENDHMMLTVRRDGKIFLDEYAIDNLDDLEGYLKNLVKDKNKTLFLQADKSVPYGLVVEVMGHIKGAGIEKLGVVADKPEVQGAGTKAKSGPGTPSKPK